MFKFQLAGWEVKPEVPTLEGIYNPAVMEQAQKMLAETGGGPLTSVCTMQGFFPWKVSCYVLLRCSNSY